MRLLGTAAIVIGLALPAPAVFTLASEFIVVDRCLDVGGSYDYARSVCDHTQSHPYVPFATRHPQLVRTFWPLAAGGVALMIIGTVLAARGSPRVV
jgi:hypothetical protein